MLRRPDCQPDIRVRFDEIADDLRVAFSAIRLMRSLASTAARSGGCSHQRILRTMMDERRFMIPLGQSLLCQIAELSI